MTFRWSGPVVVSLVTVGTIIVAVAIHPRLGLTPSPHTRGIPPCAAQAGSDLLAPAALECWLDASHGRWRIVTHVSAHGALVVEIVVEDLRDGDAVARRVVDGTRARFSEVLVYVRPDMPGPGDVSVVRTRWTSQHGFERLAFSSDRRP
jgi:hypothetical protein